MDHKDLDLESVEREKVLIAALARGRAYDHPVDEVRVLNTHISWVVLAGDFAYKIKKPIRLAFLDYATLEKRRQCCELEFELNRRWAPDIYVGVVPICGSFRAPVVGGTGTPVEYALKMHRFPQSAQLDAQLAAGRLDAADMSDLAETVAAMHAAVPVCTVPGAADFFAAIRRQMFANFDYLPEDADEDTVGRLRSWTRQSLDDHREAMIARYESGFVRECHGDLHLKNLVRLPAGIVPYDGVEFSVELRNIDVVSDVSFLVMDLVARDEPELASAFVNRYLECTGDYAGVTLLGPYLVYHALIRAKIAAIRALERARDDERRRDREEMARYCAVARRWIDAGPPRLVVMHGLSGSGKTWLSQRLLLRLPAIRLRSDLERRRMHGLDETQASGSAVAEGLYAPRERAAVYERLAGLAETVLNAGYNVIVDAAFLGRAQRDRFRDLAGRAGAAFLIISTAAARDELQRRLEGRRRAGDDPSEADVAVLEYQLDHADPLDHDERARAIEVRTDRPVDVRTLIGECLSAPGHAAESRN